MFGILGGCDAEDNPIGFIDYSEIYDDFDEYGVWWNSTENNVCDFQPPEDPFENAFTRQTQLRLVASDNVVFGTKNSEFMYSKASL